MAGLRKVVEGRIGMVMACFHVIPGERCIQAWAALRKSGCACLSCDEESIFLWLWW